jgi:hypothetical protein
MHDQRIAAIEPDVVALSRIERHEVGTAGRYLRPTWKVVAKLKQNVVVEGVEIVLTVYEPRETLHDNCEEGVERAKSCVVAFGHLTPEGFDLNADATRAAPSSLSNNQLVAPIYAAKRTTCVGLSCRRDS